MTDPRRYLIRMIIFLAIVASIAALLWVPLHGAFMGNPALNGVILGALLLGIIYVIRQTLRLSPEQRWLVGVQKNGKLRQPNAKPVLLATVYACWPTRIRGNICRRCPCSRCWMALPPGWMKAQISATVGLLVFLGLLGTFWGLLQTISAIGLVVGSLNADSNNFGTMMSQLRNGLDAPLSGMATAFSSSLFGLAGSLVLGFLDLQLGQAMGQFQRAKAGCLLSPSSKGRWEDR